MPIELDRIFIDAGFPMAFEPRVSRAEAFNGVVKPTVEPLGRRQRFLNGEEKYSCVSYYIWHLYGIPQTVPDQSIFQTEWSPAAKAFREVQVDGGASIAAASDPFKYPYEPVSIRSAAPYSASR